MIASAWLWQLEALADDVGRLRRHLTAESYARHLADRIAGRVESLDLLVQPTAGELVRAGEAVGMALRIVDRRADRVRSLLGEKAS